MVSFNKKKQIKCENWNKSKKWWKGFNVITHKVHNLGVVDEVMKKDKSVNTLFLSEEARVFVPKKGFQFSLMFF
jgi:hypothetical protein